MQKFIFSGKDLIEGSYGDVLQPFFLDGAVCADGACRRWIKPADAAPDDGGFAVDVPVDSSVEIAAFSTDDDLGKAVVSRVDSLFPGRGAVDVSPSDEFFLDLHEQIFWNNRFMVVFDVVLRKDTVVLDSLLGQEVCSDSFLKEGVSHVLFIHKTVSFDTM